MEQKSNIIICVDDTDDATKSTSTGAVAEQITEIVREHGGIVDLGITRHQPLLDQAVSYTSHNSAMAFSAQIPAGSREKSMRRRSRR